MTTTKQTGKKSKASEYDSAWKDVIEELFEAFLAFFFPEVHKDIDFTKKPVFLSKELRKIAPDGTVGKRYADELVKVWLKDGSTACVCVFIHVEVQGTKAGAGQFEERTFIYNYRIFDKNMVPGAKVISLAVLTDEDVNYRPDEYVVSQWGFELRMKIPLVKIIDYKNKKELREKLETSTNPMAMVVNAQLKSYEVKMGDKDKKYDVKRELILQYLRKGYDKKQIRSLLKFIDWIIRLPEELQEKLNIEISKIEEENKMPYVTSWERIGEKRGREKGLKEGEERGKLKTAKELVKNGVDMGIIVRATGLPREEIEKLAETVH